MTHRTSSPIISVIIPCRGHARELENCLHEVVQQRLDSQYEIIVVDSAADPAVANVVATFSGVRLVRREDNLLPGAARNLGVQHAQGQYLAFIDADCIPEPEWLAAALAALQTDAIMVGGPVLDALPYHPIAVADNLLQFADFPPYRPNGLASYFPSCNLALSQTAFHQLGGFPNTQMPAGEDTLLCDAALARWPNNIRFVRNMRVRHTGRATFRNFWQHQDLFGFCRGSLGLRLNPFYQRLGRQPLLIFPVALKRLSYIVLRTVQWHPTSLPRLFVLLPLLLAGLTAWAIGFRRGCQMAATRKAS